VHESTEKVIFFVSKSTNLEVIINKRSMILGCEFDGNKEVLGYIFLIKIFWFVSISYNREFIYEAICSLV
jgi:hypothetical protein